MPYNASGSFALTIETLIERGGGTGPMKPGNLPEKGMVPIPAAAG